MYNLLIWENETDEYTSNYGVLSGVITREEKEFLVSCETQCYSKANQSMKCAAIKRCVISDYASLHY